MVQDTDQESGQHIIYHCHLVLLDTDLQLPPFHDYECLNPQKFRFEQSYLLHVLHLLCDQSVCVCVCACEREEDRQTGRHAERQMDGQRQWEREQQQYFQVLRTEKQN